MSQFTHAQVNSSKRPYLSMYEEGARTWARAGTHISPSELDSKDLAVPPDYFAAPGLASLRKGQFTTIGARRGCCCGDFRAENCENPKQAKPLRSEVSAPDRHPLFVTDEELIRGLVELGLKVKLK